MDSDWNSRQNLYKLFSSPKELVLDFKEAVGVVYPIFQKYINITIDSPKIHKAAFRQFVEIIDRALVLLLLFDSNGLFDGIDAAGTGLALHRFAGDIVEKERRDSFGYIAGNYRF